MPDMATLLAEAFGFEKFVRVDKLQEQIDSTLEKYGEDARLSEEDLLAAAGGIRTEPSDDEGGEEP